MMTAVMTTTTRKDELHQPSRNKEIDDGRDDNGSDNNDGSKKIIVQKS